MSVSYDTFAQAFLSKVTEYDFIHIGESVTLGIIDGYMKRSCYQFNKVCKYKIVGGDDVLRAFDITISDDDIDEITDIVSEGMIVEWMKPYVYKAENLENVLNTKDFESYSPAELLLRVTNAYKMAKKDFENMIKNYSYNNGDLTDLHL